MRHMTELLDRSMVLLGYRHDTTSAPLRLAIQTRAACASLALLLILVFSAALPIQAQTNTTSAPAATADAANEGQQGEDTDGDGTIDSFFSTVTVTATGSERDTFEVATPVTVISSQEIQRLAPDNAADLLRTQPGVDINGVGPNQSRPVIRGQRGLRVLFLEDGLRLNNARRQTDFGEVTGLIDLESVGNVEVVRGPASVLYGSDAIGGVLNLVPSAPRLANGKNLGGGFELRYGSAASTKRGSALLEGVSGNFEFQLGVSRRESDDYSAPKGTFGNVKLTQEATVNDTGLKDDNLWGTLGWKINENHALKLRLSRYRADQTGFGFVEPSLIGEDTSFRIRILYPYQNFDRAVLGYTGSNLNSAMADRVEAKLYWQSNERQLVNNIDINIGPVGPGFPDSSVESDTKNFTDLDTLGFRLEAVKVFRAKDVLTYGVEGFQDDSFNTDFSRTVTTIRFPFPPFESKDVSTDSIANAPNATNASWGAFVQNEVKPIEKLQLTAGLRYQKVTTKAESTPNLDTSGLDFNDSKVVGAATATWLFIPELNAFVSYGRAFRAPSIIERLFNGPTPEGAGFQLTNPELQSEDSKNWDVGIKYRRNNAFLEAVLFRTDISGGIVQYFLSQTEKDALPQATKDQIELLGDLEDINVVQERNVDKLRYEGVELALGYRTDFGMTVGGNYTHLNAKRLDTSNPPTGDTYGDKYVGYVRWEPGSRRYWVEYRLRRNSSTPANLDPNQSVPPIGSTLPGFTVHAVAGGVTLYEKGGVKHELDLSVENLTDELYAEFSNATFFRPEPGRNVKAAYRLRF
ncbi:MAG: TonB-dependent receptor [Acidobacteriota bacterium]